MRAGMRGLTALAVGLVVAVAGAASARAGTYQVMSCGAPGAGGLNSAWVPETSGFPPSIPPDPGSYQLIDRCPTDLLVQSAPPPGNAPFLTGAS